MDTNLIGRRISHLRDAKSITQLELAKRMGFKDRQTISAIETGARKLKANELLGLIDILDTTLEQLTDPYILVGEGQFSWRHTNPEADTLERFEYKAGCWLAMFRRLAEQTGYSLPPLQSRLGLTRHSSFEEAMLAGERFSSAYELGDVPAARLVETLENKLGILVLMVDVEPGISGAACRLQNLDAVLVSRNEVVGRRHFDLAHELFHLLTWDSMPPEHTENVQIPGKSRVEKLADNFAGALLMPREALEPQSQWTDLEDSALVNQLNSTATRLQVSSVALMWQLVALQWISSSQAKRLRELDLRNQGIQNYKNVCPVLFSKLFIDVIAHGIRDGYVSVAKVAKLLDLSIEELVQLFNDHEIACPFDL